MNWCTRVPAWLQMELKRVKDWEHVGRNQPWQQRLLLLNALPRPPFVLPCLSLLTRTRRHTCPATPRRAQVARLLPTAAPDLGLPPRAYPAGDRVLQQRHHLPAGAAARHLRVVVDLTPAGFMRANNARHIRAHSSRPQRAPSMAATQPAAGGRSACLLPSALTPIPSSQHFAAPAQEVEAQVFAGELQPWLAARGYRGHYLPRQYGDSVHGPPEGVALFYRTEVGTCGEQGKVRGGVGDW